MTTTTSSDREENHNDNRLSRGDLSQVEQQSQPMIQPTTESVYQQTEENNRLSNYSHHQHSDNENTGAADYTTKAQRTKRFLRENIKLKNPLKVPQALRPPDRSQDPGFQLDPNIYATKKTVMTILCLIIIIMANSIQLKFVIKNAALIHNQFYSAQVGLGITSVLLAAFIGVFLMYVATLNYNDLYKHRKLDLLNNFAIVLLFVLIVFNIFLVAFYA